MNNGGQILIKCLPQGWRILTKVTFPIFDYLEIQDKYPLVHIFNNFTKWSWDASAFILLLISISIWFLKELKIHFSNLHFLANVIHVVDFNLSYLACFNLTSKDSFSA